MNEAVALQQAGLQSQVLWGNHEPSKLSRYNEIEDYLPARIIASNEVRTREEWKRAISDAHRVRSVGGKREKMRSGLIHNSLVCFRNTAQESPRSKPKSGT